MVLSTSVNPPFVKWHDDGSFHFDKDGRFVTMDGYPVLGFQADESGKILNKVEPIRLGQTTIQAKATKEVSIQMNLDSRENKKEFDITKPEKTSSFSNTTFLILPIKLV